MRSLSLTLTASLLIILLSGCASAPADNNRKGDDPFAKYVWPAPPDDPKIKLEAILFGRVSVEGESMLEKSLIAARKDSLYDQLDRPIGVAYDPEGRILVTDLRLGAIIRFDRKKGVMDVLGTTGPNRIRKPMGITVDSKGTIYVADNSLIRVVALTSEGEVVRLYGKTGEMQNPTDVAISPDGKSLYVTDSKAHKIIVFDQASGEKKSEFGAPGTAAGTFNYPTALAFDANGDLFIVDQLNARIQILGADGNFLDEFGELGTGFGNFVRPKGVAIDRAGVVYVSDAAFSNVQIFDSEMRLLTFVGVGGEGPGQFKIAGSVATYGDEFAVIDQLNKRVQVFRYVDLKGRPR